MHLSATWGKKTKARITQIIDPLKHKTEDQGHIAFKLEQLGDS